MHAASFTNAQTLFYTGTSVNPGTLYQDAIGGNPDVGIELCGEGQRFVGAFYALNVAGTWFDVLISYSTSSQALAFTDLSTSPSCFATSPGFMTVSPSQLTTPNPDVFKAAFPGRLYIGHAASGNPGTISQFIFSNNQARLLGDYTVTRSFNQATRQISVQSPTITFQTSSGTFSKVATDAQFGIAPDRRMVMGVCFDDEGLSCNDGAIIDTPVFPRVFNTGLTAGQVNDQQVHTRYVVMNGIGKEICIGANLQSAISLIDPDPVYYSQNLRIDFNVSNPRNIPFEINGGNVDITTPFSVRVQIANASNPAQIVYTTFVNINDPLPSDGVLSRTIFWPAFAISGQYLVTVTADVNGNIAECNELDNTAADTFDLRAITIPDIFIDGVATSTFPYPNAPFNFTIHLRNSDNLTLRNAYAAIVEENGLLLAAPTQIHDRMFNASNATVPSGVRTVSRAEFRSDFYGNASFTYIPTYNPLYQPEYNYTDLDSHVGNHSLYLEGREQDGTPFRFVLSGTLTEQYPLAIANTSYIGPYPGKEVENEPIVSQVMDFIYRTFTNFLDTVLN